jgi:hypothetical protein
MYYARGIDNLHSKLMLPSPWIWSARLLYLPPKNSVFISSLKGLMLSSLLVVAVRHTNNIEMVKSKYEMKLDAKTTQYVHSLTVKCHVVLWCLR